MKKRIISSIMVLVMMLTFIPTTVFAAEAYAPPLKISAEYADGKVTVIVKADAYSGCMGAQVDFSFPTDKLSVTEENIICSGVLEGATKNVKTTPTGKAISAAWDDSSPRRSDVEEPLLTVTFSVIDGQTGDCNFEIIKYTFTDGDEGEIETLPAGSIGTASVTIPKAPITSVTASVNAPVKGEALDFTGTVDSSAPYSISKVEWFESTNANGTPVTAPATAKAEQFYYARITLTAKPGETFAESLNNTMSGDYLVTRNSDKELYLTHSFPKTGNKTLKGIDIITNPALELDVPTAAPNATATSERSLAVTGVYDDGSGGPVAVNWEIMTSPTPKGVSLDGSTLKVTNEAEAGTFMIKATSAEGYTDSETVTIKKAAPAASAIVAKAPDTGTNITVPNGGTNTSGNCSYKVYDQYGAAMTEIGATWNMKLEPATVTGVNLIAANGSISVTNAATTCTATLHAESGALKSNEIIFNIIRETSKVTSVRVNAPEYIMNVPKVTKPGTLNQAYQQFEAAKVLDQYGQEMTGQTVTWSVADDAGNSVTGVSIDNNGLLTVTNEAPAITVYVTATCLGIESNKSKVTINKEPAKATLVEICNQVGDGPETNLHIPAATFTNSEAYTAKVYDQYGVYMPTEMVHWALNPITVNGVELDTTTSTGNAILKVDSTAAPGTTFKLKATTATPDTTGVKELDIALNNKTPASVTTAPKAVENLKYNGGEQALVTAGTASGGTMQYSLDGSSWSDAIPKGKNAGTYSVQYKAAGDSAHTDSTPVTIEVTIAPKTLTKDDLTPTGSTSKVYDGTTNSSITVGVKEGVLFGSDTLTITGTAVYNSADVNEANTITFTPNAITTGNYALAATEKLTIHDAKITPRDLTVIPVANQSKKFKEADPALTYNCSGNVSGQTPAFTGALSRAEGEAVGQYDITLDTLEMTDDVSSGFKASNYTLKMVSPAVKFEITKADAPKLKEITVSQKYTVTTEQSKDIGTAGMPEDAGALTYSVGTAEKTGSVTVTNWNVDSTGKVTYTLSGGKAGDTVILPVIIGSDNYADATVNVKITLTKPSSSGGGGGGVTTYPITVKSAKNGDVTASHKSASKGTAVTLTVDPDKGYVLDTLTVLDGKDKEIKLTEKNGKYTFTMPASKVTVEAAFKTEQSTGKNPFIDVPAGSYYEDAVIWAVDKGITTGTSATTFNPNGICTRAQAVTFLWRAAGSPAPKTKVMPFADVKADSYYYDAVLWAVENGITKGSSETMFSPDATCTRAQIVTFLWRANGSPAVSGNPAFTDVASDAYYAAAVKWAEKNDVTGGIGGGLFGSNNNCTRAQIVTFLYRSVK